jgi:hypothetical protein
LFIAFGNEFVQGKPVAMWSVPTDIMDGKDSVRGVRAGRKHVTEVCTALDVLNRFAANMEFISM